MSIAKTPKLPKLAILSPLAGIIDFYPASQREVRLFNLALIAEKHREERVFCPSLPISIFSAVSSPMRDRECSSVS
jgi:hypothetical protein